jgi:hypothetical protein
VSPCPETKKLVKKNSREFRRERNESQQPSSKQAQQQQQQSLFSLFLLSLQLQLCLWENKNSVHSKGGGGRRRMDTTINVRRKCTTL